MRSCLALLLLAAPLSAQATPAPVPEDLNEVVFGARKQPHVDVALNDHAFRAVLSLGKMPQLLWSADAAKAPAIPHDQTQAGDWLARGAATLGLHDFRPRFRRAATWRSLTVWEFDLVRAGVALLDHRIAIYWNAANEAIGILNHFPAPITGIDEPAPGDRDNENRAYFAERDSEQRYHLVVATLSRRETARHRITAIVTRRGVAYELYEQKVDFVSPLAAPVFTEWTVPNGTFPDQIWADATGLVWFSQPSNNQVTSFDPATAKFTQYPTTGGRGPDGLWVDDEDRVWTGLYYSAQLGMLDVTTKVFTAINAPYSPGNLAIPSPGSGGTVWVTDHIANRISEYDPVAKAWLGSHVLPISASWVVAGVLDPVREVVYFTGYQSHTLPYKPKGQPIGNIPVPSRAGPAFLVYHDDKVWFSLWNANRLGEYDVKTKAVTEYGYRSGEQGGPMSITPAGEPVVGTRTAGYIVVFDPATKIFTDYKIPSATGLKDGLTVAPDGAIWFTGSGVNKIARLVLK